MTRMDHSNPYKHPGSGGATKRPPSGGEDWHPPTKIFWTVEYEDVPVEHCHTVAEEVQIGTTSSWLPWRRKPITETVEREECWTEMERREVGRQKHYDA